MPALIKYLGYEDDGVDGFLCLNCKWKISMRGATWNPISYCPWCGIKFIGGFIKDGRRRRRKFNDNKNIFRTYWQVESYEKNYHSDGTPFSGETWKTEYDSFRCKSRKELLELQDKIIKEYIDDEENYKFCFADKVEFKTRLVYVRYYENVSNQHQHRGKEVIVKTLRETNFEVPIKSVEVVRKKKGKVEIPT